jgi:hypothetical protein
MKDVLVLVVLVISTFPCALGCSGGPVARTPSRHVSESELVGSWSACDASLARIRRGFFRSISPHGIPKLVLKDDESFSVKNLPALTGFTDAARPEGELINGGGGWSLSRLDERTLKLVLDFEAGSVQSGDLMLLVDVAESPEKGLVVLYWIGDPDLAQVLEFHRTSGLDSVNAPEVSGSDIRVRSPAPQRQAEGSCGP